MQWNKTYGGAGNDEAYSVVETSDGGYAIAGYTFSNYYVLCWLIKIDSSGSTQWNKTYSLFNSISYSVIQTSDGGYAIAGYTGIWPEYDFLLVKTDASGNMEWNKTYGGVGVDWAYSVIQTSDGGYTIAGYTNSSGAGGYDFWLVKTDENGVIPEFPSFLVMPLFLMATLLAVIVYRRKHSVTYWA
jgi:hypothetical protein